jgi:hypothetical protein
MSNGLRTQITTAITMRLSGLGFNLQPGEVSAIVDDVEMIVANYASTVQSEAATDAGQTPPPPQGE